MTKLTVAGSSLETGCIIIIIEFLIQECSVVDDNTLTRKIDTMRVRIDLVLVQAL